MYSIIKMHYTYNKTHNFNLEMYFYFLFFFERNKFRIFDFYFLNVDSWKENLKYFGMIFYYYFLENKMVNFC